MNEAILIWLFLSVGKLVNFAVLSVALLTFAWSGVTLILAIGTDCGTEDDCHDWAIGGYNKLVKSWKTVFVTVVVTQSLASFYPSRDDLKWIIGGAVVWNVAEAGVESEELQALPDNVLGAMNHFLESVQEEQE